MCSWEPVSELCKTLFKNYRQIKVRVLGWLKEARSKRAANTNKFRRSKTIRPGDEVVIRDPRQRKAGGRTPYKQPYTEPALVLKVYGNKCTVKDKNGMKLEQIHLEDVMLVPENARNLEKEPLIFEEEDDLLLDDVNRRRSPGEMLEDEGRRLEEHMRVFDENKRKKLSPGKLEKLQTGNFVAYLKADRVKVVAVGKVTAISRAEQNVILHRYYPVTDGQLRLYWTPVFSEEGVEEVQELFAARQASTWVRERVR